MIVPLPSVLAAAGAALLLAAPGVPLAQSKPRPAAPSAPAATRPAARPAPAAGAPAAPTPEPDAPLAEPAEAGPWRVALVVGREKDGDSELSGPRLQVQLERDLVPLGSRGRLSFVAAIGWFHGTKEDSIPLGGASMDVETTGNLYEVIPSFRATFALLPRLRLFAEIGAGGGWMKTTIDTTLSVGGFSDSVSEDSWAGVLRLSAGGSWQLNDRIRLGVELPTIHRRYGETTSQSLTFAATAAYAF